MANSHQRQRGPTEAEARRIFSHLDGETSPEERARFETAAATDPALAARLKSCRALVAALESLEPHSPSADFPLRIAAALPVRPSLWQRLRRALSRLPARPESTLPGGFLDEALSRLPHHAPAPGFAARVMHGVRLPDRAAAPVRSPARPGWLIPVRSRARLVAALAGLALGPAVAAGALARMLFTNNPLVTPSNLGGFLVSKANTALTALRDLAFDLAGPVLAPFGGLPAGSISPLGIVAIGAAIGLLTLASIWILYAYLFRSPGPEQRNATV